MTSHAGRPKHIKYNEFLSRFIRLKRNFAVRPYGYDEKRWAEQRIAIKSPKEHSEEERKKHHIREVEKGVKGLNFPADEMARVIHSWIASEE